jgi:hypothetical protein
MEGREVNFSFIVYSYLSHQIRCLVATGKANQAVGGSTAQLYHGLTQAVPIAFSDSPWISTFLATHRRLNRSTEHFGWYNKSEYVISHREAENFLESTRSPRAFQYLCSRLSS